MKKLFRNKYRTISNEQPAMSNCQLPIANCLLPIALCLLLIPQPIHAQAPLTIDIALQRAYTNHPVMQQGNLLIEQQQTLIKTATTFDPLNITGSYGQINSGVNDYNIGLSQSFKLPGAYKADKKVLQQNVNVAKATAAVTKNELTKNVSTAYYNWLYTWQHYYLLNELDSTYKDFENYANKKFNVGETGILEKTNAKTQLADVQLQKKQALADIAIFENELQQWMVTTDKLQPPEEYQQLPQPITTDTALLANNSVLQYVQQQMLLSNAVVQAEKAKGLPSFSIGAATQSLDKATPFNIVSAGINIPIFNNGVKARTKAAQYNVKIAEKETEKTKLMLSSVYTQLFEQYNKTAEQLKYYQAEGLQYAETIIKAANKSYKAGNIGYVEYVQNIKEAVNIKAGYLQTVNEYNQSIIQINFLLNK